MQKNGEIFQGFMVNYGEDGPKNGRTVDQISWIIGELKAYPQRKHHVFSVWNPEYLYSMALPGEALLPSLSYSRSL